MTPASRSSGGHVTAGKRDPNLDFADWIRVTLRKHGVTQKAIAEHRGIRDKNKVTKDLGGSYLPSCEYVEMTYLRPIERLTGHSIPNAERAEGLSLYGRAARTTRRAAASPSTVKFHSRDSLRSWSACRSSRVRPLVSWWARSAAWIISPGSRRSRRIQEPGLGEHGGLELGVQGAQGHQVDVVAKQAA